MFACFTLLVSLSAAAPAAMLDNAPKSTVAFEKLIAHAQSLRAYARTQGASTQYGILIDMGISSWNFRYFLVDLNNDSVLVEGLCGHGEGADVNSEDVQFSNVPNSLCTSQGRYKIGGKYYGTFGFAYRLYGLDATNSNAYDRLIVLHAHPKVGDIENEKPCCRSWGCPMVSPDVFKATSRILDNVQQPVLLWIYK